MTVRVITLRIGAGDYYLNDLPSYYLDADEPRGRWLGRGADELGLDGELDDADFRALMAGMDPRQPARELGRPYTQKSVVGFDATASAPKSVSVLWALGDVNTSAEVLAAHEAAVTAMAEWIEDHAHTRFRINGEIAVLDTDGIVAAGFRQHTSRTLDPQLHTHLVIANRVMSPDGRWLALDARTLKLDQRTLSAIYHAGLRAELTARLGVVWQSPVNGIAEIAGVPDVLLAEFSTRTTAVNDRFEAKLDRFTAAFEREPTRRERWKLEREAAKDSRPSKNYAVDAASLHDAWHAQARALGIDIGAVIRDVTDRIHPSHSIPGRSRESEHRMVFQAIDSLTTSQSSWRPAELTRELAAAIPTTTAGSASDIRLWLDDLTANAARSCIDISAPIPPNTRLRSDGRPVTESAVGRALTTSFVLHQERELIDWVDQRLAYDGRDADLVAAQLTPAQQAAAAAVAGDDDLVLVVGPAGTGKTTALRPAVERLREDGRAVFGVAPSATAAQVLSEETGVDADTIDKLLIEHNLTRPPDHRYNLPLGATVIVDEAGMLGTAKLAELAHLADEKGWRVAMIGDPLQFSAVDRGGPFGMLVDTFGAIELDQVHRFTQPWERDASLRLRRGDTTVTQVYQDHGRIHHGTPGQMQTAIVNDWWAHRQAGRDVLLLAGTNDDVTQLNHRCQRLRIDAHEVRHERTVDTGTYQLHVGDEILTRHNDRQLRTDRGEMVRNGATWTITAIHADHTLTATGNHGAIRLPATYVTDHVQLAYARTINSAQGRTVEPCLVYNEGALGLRALYVGLSRGCQENHVYFGTTGVETGRDLFIQSMMSDRIDQPAHVRRAELAEQEIHHPGLLDGDHLRRLFEERHGLTVSLKRAEVVLRSYPGDHTLATRDLAVVMSELAALRERMAAAEGVIERCDRPLHRRRRQGEIDLAHRELTDLPRDIRRAELVVDAGERRITTLDESRSAAADTAGRRPAADTRIRHLDDTLDRDLRARTRITRFDTPSQVLNAIGTRPFGRDAAERWDAASGLIAQHESAFGTDQSSSLDRSAAAYNYATVSAAITEVKPVPPTPTRTMAREIEPDFGL